MDLKYRCVAKYMGTNINIACSVTFRSVRSRNDTGIFAARFAGELLESRQPSFASFSIRFVKFRLEYTRLTAYIVSGTVGQRDLGVYFQYAC
jgi:hypothetical protein